MEEDGLRTASVRPFLAVKLPMKTLLTKSKRNHRQKGKKINKAALKRDPRRRIRHIATTEEELDGKIIAEDVIDPRTGEVLLKCNDMLTADSFAQIYARGVNSFKILFIDNLHVDSSLRDTLTAGQGQVRR